MSRYAGHIVTLIAVATFGAAAHADLGTDLAGLWTFENAANLADDTSSYDNDGSVVIDQDWDSNIYQGAGLIGSGAATFETSNAGAANHYIDIPNATQLNGTSETVSYWIKTTQNEDYVDHIRHSGHLSHKTTGAYDVPGGWAPITFDAGGGFGNSFKLQSQGGNNLGEQGWDGTYIDGEWHHIVTVYDETTNTLKTWIDRELVIEQVQSHLSGGLAPSTSSLKFGGYDGGFGGSLIGSLDQIRIYNVAKSYEVDADGTLIGGDLYDMYMEIPEPASLLLIAVGALALRRR